MFPIFWPLDAKIQVFRPKIRNLRKKSPLEPDSQVWNRISSLKNLQINFLTFFLSVREVTTLAFPQGFHLVHQFLSGVNEKTDSKINLTF